MFCTTPILNNEISFSYSLCCFSPYQNAFPTQGLSSTHVLSLDALLAIVHNFQAGKTARQDSGILPMQQSPGQVKMNVRESDSCLSLPRGSTQINSAGIIFTSSAGEERYREEDDDVTSLTISTVRSESALPVQVGLESESASNSATVSKYSSVDGDVVRAASGYMRAVEREEGELVGEASSVALPTPKELIEIRQKKKVK